MLFNHDLLIRMFHFHYLCRDLHPAGCVVKTMKMPRVPNLYSFFFNMLILSLKHLTEQLNSLWIKKTKQNKTKKQWTTSREKLFRSFLFFFSNNDFLSVFIVCSVRKKLKLCKRVSIGSNSVRGYQFGQTL